MVADNILFRKGHVVIITHTCTANLRNGYVGSKNPLSYPGGKLEVRGQKLLKTIWVSKVTSQGNHICSVCVCVCVRAYMH